MAARSAARCPCRQATRMEPVRHNITRQRVAPGVHDRPTRSPGNASTKGTSASSRVLSPTGQRRRGASPRPGPRRAPSAARLHPGRHRRRDPDCLPDVFRPDRQECRSPERPRGTARRIAERVARGDERGGAVAPVACRHACGRHAPDHARAVVTVTRHRIEPTKVGLGRGDRRRGRIQGGHDGTRGGRRMCRGRAVGRRRRASPGIGARVQVPPPVR